MERQSNQRLRLFDENRRGYPSVTAGNIAQRRRQFVGLTARGKLNQLGHSMLEVGEVRHFIVLDHEDRWDVRCPRALAAEYQFLCEFFTGTKPGVLNLDVLIDAQAPVTNYPFH